MPFHSVGNGMLHNLLLAEKSIKSSQSEFRRETRRCTQLLSRRNAESRQVAQVSACAERHAFYHRMKLSEIGLFPFGQLTLGISRYNVARITAWYGDSERPDLEKVM